jgi:hypothetical protein
VSQKSHCIERIDNGRLKTLTGNFVYVFTQQLIARFSSSTVTIELRIGLSRTGWSSITNAFEKPYVLHDDFQCAVNKPQGGSQ